MAPPLTAARLSAWAAAALLASSACAAEQSAAGARPGLIYHNYCSVCHGDRGDGRSRARASLVPPPRDFTDPALGETLTRETMIAVVRDGKPGTAMVGWKTQLQDADIEAVVDYIRSAFMGPESKTAPAPRVSGTRAHGGRLGDAQATADMSLPFPRGLVGDAARGRRFYSANCVPCHGNRGDGKGPRAYFINPKPRDFLDASARASLNRPSLFAGIAMGKVGTEMPAWSKVVDDQRIADVAEYVFVTFIRTASARERSGSAEPGHELYNRHCAFCHGYSGDARTIASGFLDPKPRDFTSAAAAALTPERIRVAIRDGRPGTAMQAFSSVLDPAEIAAVGDFVLDEFVIRKSAKAGYHTAANGWPDHERYRAAFAFVAGDTPVDAADLSAEQLAGRRLYLSACRTCHERGAATPRGWELRAVSFPENRDACTACHASRRAGPYQGHGAARQVAEMSAEERRGQALFLENCAFCHAADGSGRNWIGVFLEPHPRDLADPAFRARSSRSRLAEAIRAGLPGTSMPAWGPVLDRRDIAALVAYIAKAFGPLGESNVD